ncbi:MAG: hypothetical protein QOE33_2149 [Acidobacteriota bacterium]|nr:hypothetical protein [Acidobacteriota bacterium]
MINQRLSNFTVAILCLAAFAPLAAAQQLAKLSNDKSVDGSSSSSSTHAREERGPLRRLASLRGGETAEGWRVVVTSDSALDDYAAYREGARFVVRIPRSDASAISNSVGGAFAPARVEQRGADALLSFALPEGVAARVRQTFNRLEVIFSTRVDDGAQQRSESRAQQQPGDGVSQQQPKPTPTPASPTNAQAQSPNAPQPSPATSDPPTARETIEASKTVASAGGSHAVTLPPEKAGPVRLPRFEKAPVIDGRLDDEIWKHAAVFKDFYQIEPGDNIAPSKPTEVFIGFDSHYLYVAFHAYDDPTQVRARVAKRDDIGDDDNVGLFFDTFHDHRRAYQLEFNPLGIQADAIRTEGNGEDYSFDLVMESKGLTTADGYTVEAAIPFKSLRYEAGKGKLWGLHIFRSIKHLNNETDSWMPISRDIEGMLIQEGAVTGLEGISTARTLDVIPSLTLSETGRRVRATPPEPSPGGINPADPTRLLNEPIHHDIGLTGKFTLTPTITLDFAYNPDFAQVEADQTVVTANQRFPIFFEEKRPFFLEGKEIFDTQSNVVHTRSIIDPDYAVKLTGKRGRNTFGLIAAVDAGPGSFSEDERQDPANARFVGKKAYVGVLRAKRDVGAESSVGAFATSYNFIEKHNQLAGLDGRFKLDPKTIAAFEVIGTTSRRFFRDPDLDPEFTFSSSDPISPGALAFPGQQRYRTGNGFAYSGLLDYTGRHFGYTIHTNGRTRDYRADVGFTQQTNTNESLAAFRLSTEPNPKAALTKFRLQNFTVASYNWQGHLQSWSNGTNYDFFFAHQTFVHAGTNLGYERVFEEEFGARRGFARPTGRFINGAFAGDDSERQTRHKTVFVYAERQFTKQFYASAFVGTQRGLFDFDFGAGPRFPRVSPAFINAEVERNRLRSLLRQSEPALSDAEIESEVFRRVPDQLDPGSANTFDVNTAINYKPTNALNLSLEYTKARLTRRDNGLTAFDDNIYSLRTTYQFTRYTFARARADYDTLASNVRGQFLLGWTPNPGTAFYAGYNDDLNRNGFSPFTGQLEPGFRRNGRTFFIKMSYLFRRSFE